MSASSDAQNVAIGGIDRVEPLHRVERIGAKKGSMGGAASVSVIAFVSAAPIWHNNIEARVGGRVHREP